jgi:hypothetical protein
MIILRRIRLAENAARMGERRNYTILVGKPGGKRSL